MSHSGEVKIPSNSKINKQKQAGLMFLVVIDVSQRFHH